MTMSLYLNWHEEDIHWDRQNYSNISCILVPYEKIWKPQIFLVNAVQKIIDISNEGVKIRVDNDGQAYWNSGRILKSACSPNVKYYPFTVM